MRAANEKALENTLIPNVLIDEYLTKARPEHLAVFLYARRWASESCPTIKTIAEDLFLRELDVITAVRYWEEAGLIVILNPSMDGFAYEFKGMDRELNQEPEVKTPVKVDSQPYYTPFDINRASEENDEVKYLLTMAQRIFSRALKHSEMNLIMGFYDSLALPVPVIEVMLDYCVSNNKTGSRYLEKVAMNWSDMGITTVDEAEAYIEAFNKDYRDILKALGNSRRDPTPKEVVYMRKWLRELKVPLELVLEACGRTVIQTGSASFKYADKILTGWSERGITTLEQANADEEEFKSKQKPAAGTSKKPPKSKFANYKGREWDFEELERLAGNGAFGGINSNAVENEK